MVIAVVPIAVAAVRDGLRNWEPTWDAAITAVRVRDVFSSHPPLTGLFASASNGTQATYSYLGALEFYLLAVPVRLLGTTWGLLLGMAAINITVVLVALWLVRRRVGEVGAIVAAVFVASLLWTLGSEILIDPTPMQAGILPFFALLIAAWSVADGDRFALLVLAILGNYLVLLHLKFMLVVPVVGIVALVCWVQFLRAARRSDPDAWPSRWRRHRRWFVGALVVTLAMWLPVLYDQFISADKNLGKLIDAVLHGGGGSSHTTLLGAIGAVVSVTAVPPLWLPSTFAHPPFDPAGGGQPLVIRIVFGLVLLAGFAVSARWTRRRHDRALGSGLVVAGAAWVAWVATWLVNPNADTLPIHYFWGLWPLSVFIWFLLVMVAGRAASASCGGARGVVGAGPQMGVGRELCPGRGHGRCSPCPGATIVLVVARAASIDSCPSHGRSVRRPRRCRRARGRSWS